MQAAAWKDTPFEDRAGERSNTRNGLSIGKL